MTHTPMYKQRNTDEDVILFSVISSQKIFRFCRVVTFIAFQTIACVFLCVSKAFCGPTVGFSSHQQYLVIFLHNRRKKKCFAVVFLFSTVAHRHSHMELTFGRR